MVSFFMERWQPWMNGEADGLFTLQELHYMCWRLVTIGRCIVKGIQAENVWGSTLKV